MKLEIGLVALACALVAANVLPPTQADNVSGLPKLGAYDPQGLLANESDVSIDHIFVDWNKFDSGKFGETAALTAGRGRQLMVTVEPWTRASNKFDGKEILLSDTVSGGFDAEIAAVCTAIGSTGAPMMISWGHEMDEDEGRFPWANQDSATYKDAYRHFVSRCRSYAPVARFGWTPKGEQTLASYYPGSEHVDFVGVTLFDLQVWNKDHGDTRSFHEKFAELHGRVAGFGKPVVLAEFGVGGDDAYREQALSCAREELRQFPGVEAVVYFNDRETWQWPKPYGRPDWRVADASAFRCASKQAATTGNGPEIVAAVR